ncbi:hypothetical protein J5N97_030190 [Dioscorea zingiberensis]|uniref:UBC core domain-containing protein n=1 Tax=Dioscorea zingiberensis TaxID=325984 RepID=A0A9D5BWL8_9LILI|nr:hypothetical protein J5N97_030190 [Dioscorea zingiberensis]
MLQMVKSLGYVADTSFTLHDIDEEQKEHNLWNHSEKLALAFGLMVYPDGRVCISILHAPGDDPNGYELASERWTPVHTVESIVLSIISMLSSPNDESPANIEAAVVLQFFQLII